MADEKKESQKLTPLEIHNKEFKKRGLSGYDRREVDSFLDQIINDYGDALDQTVDLKNEIVHLQEQVSDLQKQVKQYKQNEDATKEAVGNAKIQAERIINDATVQANNTTEQAKIDTDYQRQQLETIKSDYERVKKEASGYRSYIQDLLQKAIENLNDENWQKALDKYFDTERFYPPDGAEPIMLTDEDEDVDEDDDDEDIDGDEEVEVDNGIDDEVNFEQDTEEDNNSPKPMTGDSPSVETVNNEDTSSNNGSGTTVIFPDDYKNH